MFLIFEYFAPRCSYEIVNCVFFGPEGAQNLFPPVDRHFIDLSFDLIYIDISFKTPLNKLQWRV